MNIFLLSKNPKKCAELLWKSSPLRANKQILELAQVMSTALQQGYKIQDENLYKATHQKHPITIWAETQENFTWCYDFLIELNEKFYDSTGKNHKSAETLLPIFYKYRWHWFSQKPINKWQNSSMFQDENNIIKAYNKTIFEKLKMDVEKSLININQFNTQITFLKI